MTQSKRSAFAMIAIATLSTTMLIASVPRSAGQDVGSERKLRFGVKPLEGGDMDTILQQSNTPGTGLKVWSYSIKSTRSGSKGTTYKGVMVGNSPITTNATTTTTVYVVPLIVQIGSLTFDPTVADNNCYGGLTPVTALGASPMVLA